MVGGNYFVLCNRKLLLVSSEKKKEVLNYSNIKWWWGDRYLERREWLAVGQVVVWLLHLARATPAPFVAATLLALALLFPVSSFSARSVTYSVRAEFSQSLLTW